MKHIKHDFRSKAWVPPLCGLRGWDRDQNSNFPEYGRVAYQIKGNDACSNIVANIFLADIPHPLMLGSKGQMQLFQNMIMFHIKLNAITNAATCKHIFCPYTHPRPLGWGQRSKQCFSESSHVAYQIRRELSIEHHAITYSVLTHTLDPWGGVKGQNIFFWKLSCCISN